MYCCGIFSAGMNDDAFNRFLSIFTNNFPQLNKEHK